LIKVVIEIIGEIPDDEAAEAPAGLCEKQHEGLGAAQPGGESETSAWMSV
jgi:hypothetical protein